VSIIKRFKILINQIKAHPMPIILFILSFISMATLISVWTSNVTTLKDLALQKTEGIPKNTLSVKASFGENISFEKFIEVFESISEDTNITFGSVSIDLNSENEEEKRAIVLEYFKETPEWRYPLISGRDYTKEEVMNGEKKVLIGKNMTELMYNENGVEKINIQGSIYEVVGVVGRKNKETPWDDEIFMSLKVAPEKAKIRFSGVKPFIFLIKNSNRQPIEDCNELSGKIIGKQGSFTEKEIDEKNDVIGNTFAKNNDFTEITIIITILVLINMMSISMYWINDRIEEIGIRKAFGMNDKEIIKMIINELFSICIISFILVLIVQFILSMVLHNTKYSLNLTLQNCYSGIVISLISTIVTILLPIYHILKIQPIEVLKGD